MMDRPGIFERGVRSAERGVVVARFDSALRTPNSALESVTAKISGFNRLPRHASQNSGAM